MPTQEVCGIYLVGHLTSRCLMPTGHGGPCMCVVKGCRVCPRALLAWRQDTLTQLRAELSRLAVDEAHMDPVDAIAVRHGDGGDTFVFYDDHGATECPAATALAALRRLPDAAGWTPCWDALLEGEPW